MEYFTLDYFTIILQATLQTKPNKIFLPQPLEGSVVASKKTIPILLPPSPALWMRQTLKV